MGKVYETYELLEAIAHREIKEKSQFIITGGTYDKYKAYYKEGNIIINSFGQNVMMGTKLLSEDCIFELLEDEEKLEELDKESLEGLDGFTLTPAEKAYIDKINEIIRVVNKMQQDKK